MSAITKRSTTTLSILKKANSRTSTSRVRFRLPSNVRKIFLDLKNGVSSKDYEDLVCTIRDCEISDNDLLTLLNEAKNCISLLDYDLRLFVQALVILGWNYRSEDVINSYQDFMNNLVSAHPQHAKVVIDQLVKLFMNSDGTDWADGVPSATDAHVFSNIHLILRSIVKIVPLTEDIVLTTMKTNFPYFRLPVEKQRAYIYNCLKVIDYLPQCRREILQILVEKLLLLDVNSPREDILDSTGDMLAVDEMSSGVIESLDYGMIILFRYIDYVCRPAGEILGAETKALFDDLMEILDKSLLTTYGCCHVQFIIFYVCSFGSKSIHMLAKKFLAKLWKKVLEPSVAPIVRRSAAGYIGSYLARANYLPTGFLKKHLQEMSTWLLKYIEESHNQSSQWDIHGVFFAVCQSVFYVIAFRHKDLVDSTKKLKFLQSLNLSKVVNCSLNPLRACSPAVVDNFAAITRDYELVYCYSIIENNRWNFLNTPCLVDTFFPFDPYILKRSSRYISPLYNEYRSPNEEDDEDPAAMETDMPNGKKVDEEDDFISDRGHTTPMKIPDFNYSTSPGFKMSI